MSDIVDYQQTRLKEERETFESRLIELEAAMEDLKQYVVFFQLQLSNKGK